MNHKVQHNLAEHIRAKHEAGHKQAPETDLTPDDRMRAIQDCFANAAKKVGFGPITKDKLDQVQENMMRRGVIDRCEPYQLRMQRTIKSFVKTWATTNLKMEEQQWNSIQVEKIVQSPSESGDIIFLTCQSAEDVSIITSHAKNLPQGGNPNAPRIVMYVDPKARARYAAVQSIAKTIRATHAKSSR